MSAVKNHVDKKILESLGDGFDQARISLLESILKFSKMVNYDIDFSDDQVKDIKDTRERKICELVMHSKKRMGDLYRVEANFTFDATPTKKFKLLIFKERLNKSLCESL